jgi:hypothetical protein
MMQCTTGIWRGTGHRRTTVCAMQLGLCCMDGGHYVMKLWRPDLIDQPGNR